MVLDKLEAVRKELVARRVTSIVSLTGDKYYPAVANQLLELDAVIQVVDRAIAEERAGGGAGE